MRRFVPLLIAGIALIVSGCQDTSAPPAAESLATLVPAEDRSFSSVVSRTEDANAVEIKFIFSRGAGSARLGDFTLAWEENSVCERDTSGYGWEYWRLPCDAENEDVEITARVWKQDGRAYVDFAPDIRFSPAKNVTLLANRPEIIGRRLTKKLMKDYNIYYTYRIGDTRFFVDDAWYDAEQRTHYDTVTGDVWREIRHFSGFVIRTGEETETTTVSTSTSTDQ